MKILQINPSYKPAYIYGGPTMSVSKLSEQLIKAGDMVNVFTTTANGNTELEVLKNLPVIVDGVPVYYYRRITKDHSHLSPRLLRAVWQHAKHFEVVHIHAWWNTVSVLSCLIALSRGVKVIVSPRGTLSAYSFSNKNVFFKKAIHYLLGRPLLNRCTIHVTSLHEKTAIDQLIKPKQVFVIPNFINLPAKQQFKTPRTGDVLKLIFFSRIEEKKGLDILLNALEGVHIPYHLTIAGNGNADYIDSLKQIALQNNLTDHITWAGFQSDNKFDVLAEHHLLILPSHDENFGNVVIESLCVGTAVLISTQVGLADYVSENKLGWICPPNTPAFAKAIDSINRNDLDDIRNKAPAIIYHDFNDDNLVKRYTDMYRKIIHHD